VREQELTSPRVPRPSSRVTPFPVSLFNPASNPRIAVLLPLVSLTVVLSVGDGLPVRPPRAVGMDADRLALIDNVVQRGIRAGGYPGASVVIGRRGYAVWQKGYGTLSWSRSSAPVDPDQSIYDLASLTKVIATTTATMILYDEGKLSLDSKVQEFLPEFAGPMKDKVTIRHLLSHRSGLPPGRQLWRTAKSPAEAWAQVMAVPLGSRPNTYFDYSDLGPMVLGKVIERISGKPLDQFVAERVFRPLGMDDTGYLPATEHVPRIAPTETHPPRRYPLRGEVHDESAFTLGKVSGHAGLFGSATDLSIFAQMLLNGGTYNGVRIVTDTTIARFITPVADFRALGWEVANGERGAGEYLSARSFGHTGYTGTSVWIDPERQMFVIILTNRVHAPRTQRPGTIIADVRADIADAAALAINDVPALREVAWPRIFRVEQAVDWNPQTRPLPKRPTTKARVQ
jgi:CubicO group peptidase (beta-lactamase class C family)